MPKYKQQKFTLKLPDGYSKAEQEAIATEVIDFIIDRTQKKNKDKRNRDFKPYSKEYAGSLDFKIAGKSKNKVDLTLSEEMLNELKLVKNRLGEVEIGYDGRRSKLNGKVEGNILGTYGQKKSTGKARDFLGITKKDLDTILENYPLEDKVERAKRLLEMGIASKAAERLIGNLELRDGEDG